jgi:hypothetical protein
MSTIACARALASSTSLNVGGGAPWPLLTLAHAALASCSEKIFVKRACGRAIVASMGVLRLRCILCSRSVGQRPVPLSAKAGRETGELFSTHPRAAAAKSISRAFRSRKLFDVPDLAAFKGAQRLWRFRTRRAVGEKQAK